MSEPLLESSFNQTACGSARGAIVNQKESDAKEDGKRASTLIEFPGTTRPVPEWRRQLSQRVREVQERRAREAAEAAAVQASAESVACALPSAQLELVPDPEQPAMKPIVSKALERLERARQLTPENELAAIVDELIESQTRTVLDSDERESRKSKLVVVPPPEPAEFVEVVLPEPEITPTVMPTKSVRLMSEGIEEHALSYLENCLSIPVVDFYPSRQPAGAFRRLAGGVVDLLFIGGITLLCAAAVHEAGGEWNDPRVIELIAGTALALIFSYFTLMVALTGRTLGMRLLSLRTIDKRTGLIPTGGQSMKRAFSYTMSLILFGLGFLYALIDRDRCTVHDRFSQTMVIQD